MRNRGPGAEMHGKNNWKKQTAIAANNQAAAGTGQ